MPPGRCRLANRLRRAHPRYAASEDRGTCHGGDLFELDRVECQLRGLDACLFCVGVSSSGMSDEDYHLRLILSAAGVLARLNTGMTFVYVSGAGTDSSERRRSMWARVKGATENAPHHLPFKAAYMFRPGAIGAQAASNVGADIGMATPTGYAGVVVNHRDRFA